MIYSYATHLRKGSYRSLPHSRSTGSSASTSDETTYENSAIPDEDEEIEDFYRLPLRTSQGVGGGTAGGSITSFADFVSAPGRGRKTKTGGSSLSRVSNSANGRAQGEDVDEEVLIDGGDNRDPKSNGEDHLQQETAFGLQLE